MFKGRTNGLQNPTLKNGIKKSSIKILEVSCFVFLCHLLIFIFNTLSYQFHTFITFVHIEEEEENYVGGKSLSSKKVNFQDLYIFHPFLLAFIAYLILYFCGGAYYPWCQK
jgi:hypothetical protein